MICRQVAALRHPSVKEALKIPQMVKHEKKEKKSFVENIKESESHHLNAQV